MDLSSHMTPQSARLTGGKRLRGIAPWVLPNQPRITVITVTFNAEKEFPATLQSVCSQSYPNVEFVVIDGGSTDGTLDQIRQAGDGIDFWISEPDKGIYDAFNKGSRNSTGEWIFFLGAGDIFYADDVLDKVANAAGSTAPGTEMLYTRVCLTRSDGSIVEFLNLPWEQMRGQWVGGRPMIPHHQGVFHSRALVERDPFDVTYKVAADSKLMIKSILRAQPVFVDVVASYVPIGGVSTTPKYFMRTASEIRRANRDAGVRNFPHELLFYLNCRIKSLFYKVMGDALTKQTIDKFRQMTGRSVHWRH